MKKLFYNEYGYVHEAWKVTGVVLGVCVIFILSILLVAGTISIIEAGGCARLDSYESQHDYRWGLFTGCMVQTKAGYWVDSNNPTLLELEE